MSTALFQSATLQALYDGTATGSPASAALLANYRKAEESFDPSDTSLASDIEALDKRIATFEQVLIGSTSASGKSSAEYPFDRTGLRRELLDEVTVMLLRQTDGDPDFFPFAEGGVIEFVNRTIKGPDPNDPFTITDIPDPNFKGGTKYAIVRNGASGNLTGQGVFDNLNTDVPTDSDPRLNMLSANGKLVFKAYANLIDAIFAEGDKIGLNPSRTAQVASAIQPITVDGVTYSRIAERVGFSGTPETYLVEAGMSDLHVKKDLTGQAVLDGPATSSAKEIRLNPQEAVKQGTSDIYRVNVDGIDFEISLANGVFVKTTGISPPRRATIVPALTLNVPGKAEEFPDVRLLLTASFTAENGSTYLIGPSSENKVYVTSLNASHRTTVGTTATLSGMEYLLFFNEARIRILRGQLAYKEAVVREIQDDLRKANDALADLEQQSGAIQATDSDGTKTSEVSSVTFRQSQFQATNGYAGNIVFGGTNATHGGSDWATNRANLKNYIDRRSSEAQDASLDYQNVLNRFNNGLEVLAKLQEKLDNLLKAQLRNLG